MADDALEWLDASLLLTSSAKALWQGMNEKERYRLTIFVETTRDQLSKLAENFRHALEQT